MFLFVVGMRWEVNYSYTAETGILISDNLKGGLEKMCTKTVSKMSRIRKRQSTATFQACLPPFGPEL